MINAGTIMFNNEGNKMPKEYLMRSKDQSEIVKYILWKDNTSEGSQDVQNGFEAGQIHKCTIFHNVLPRIDENLVQTTKDKTSSFCCVGFGVRKTGNDGTIEQ